MQFIHADLGRRQRGDVVEVTLKGNQANVLLLDSSGFNAFKRGRQARGVGGLAKRSPVRLTIPRTGRWYGVAYLPAGHRGRVKAGFRVLPGALPPIRQSSPSPLGSIRQAADHYADVLADDDMPDRGLTACRFGVVVLSQSFFAKGWPNYELDGLVTREVTGGRQLILPIWHNATHADVAGYSAPLASKLARSTADSHDRGDRRRDRRSRHTLRCVGRGLNETRRMAGRRQNAQP